MEWKLLFSAIKKFLWEVIRDPKLLAIMGLIGFIVYAYFWQYVPLQGKLNTTKDALSAAQTSLNDANMQLNSKRLEIGQLKANVSTLELAIADQNKAIQKLNEQRDELKTWLEIAKQENVGIRESANRRIHELLNASVPKECSGAVEWGIEQGRRLGTW